MLKTFAGQVEPFSNALRSLMLPHPEGQGGEVQSVANAFQFISQGLEGLNDGKLDDQAREWVKQIRALMKNGEATNLAIARQLNIEQRRLLSQTVYELAHWFRSYCPEN